MKQKDSYKYLERADYTWSKDSIRFINTPTQAARNTFFYVQEVGYFITSPPYFTERANLNSFLMLYTLKGRGKLEYQGETYIAEEKTVFLINCMEHHLYKGDTNGEWEFLWVHFNGVSALGYYQEFVKNGFHILRGMDEFFIESTMRRILSLTQKREIHSEIIVSGLIMELLTQFLIESSSESLGISIMPQYLKRILKEMENRFLEPLTLDDYAQNAGVSKFHFSREFKRYIGSPPGEYLIVKRINYAKELLRYSDCSVEQVAYTCGFNSVSHFIQLFKRHENKTPLYYRKEWIDKSQERQVHQMGDIK